MTEGNVRKRGYLLLSPLAAGLILTLVFKAAHRFPGDTHIFMCGDYLVQFVNYIKMFWNKLLSGNGLFYSFDLGMGAATWEHYAFYGFSPFNLVFLLIKDADTAAFVLLLAKVCMIALCMHLFMRYALKISESAAVLFSVSYALSAYVFNFHVSIIFMDYPYLLAIVMLMLVRFFRTGKAGGLALAYALSFMISYYGGYMIGVFSFVCFAVMLVSGKYSMAKKKLLAGYLSAVLAAVLLSAVVTLPAAVAILSGQSGESGKVTDLGLMAVKLLADLLPLKRVTIKTMEPSIYTGLPVLLFALAYFTDKSIDRRKKTAAAVPLIFLLICMLFKPAYLMMHGFDEPDGYYFRFVFLFSFYLAVVATEYFKKENGKSALLPYVIVFSAAVLAAVAGKLKEGLIFNSPGLIRILALGIFLALYFVLLGKLDKFRTGALCAVLFAELLMNGYYSITPDTVHLFRWQESYQLWNRHGDEMLDKISVMEENDPDPFYRVNFRQGIWTNDAMYFGFHGLGYFSSMEQRDTRALLSDLGYVSGKRVVAEKGGSPFTGMIFSQKYDVRTDPDIRMQDCEKVEVTKNEQVLPLAFMVSEGIKDYRPVNNAFENQQALLDLMLGHEVKIWNRYTGDLYADTENASIEETADGYKLKRSGEANGLVILSMDAGEGEEDYAYLSTKEASTLKEGIPLTFSDAEDASLGLIQESTLYMPRTIRLGNNNGTGSVYILFNEAALDEAEFEEIYFAAFDHQGLAAAFEELKPGGLRIREMRDDDIRGTVSVADGKNLMFTSIPYDENWHVECDGKEAETLSVLNGAFLACEIPDGEHEIRLYFRNKHIGTGALLSLAGIVFFIGMMIYQKRDKGLKELKEDGESKEVQ